MDHLAAKVPPPPDLVYWCREACTLCIWLAVMNRGKTIICDRR